MTVPFARPTMFTPAFRKTCRHLLLTAAFVPPLGAAPPAHRAVITSQPIRVIATTAQARPDYVFEVDLEVTNGNNAFHVQTMPYGAKTWDAAVAAIKRRVTWTDGYLFVGTDCGGGNAWCCHSEQVFTVADHVVLNLGRICSTGADAGSGLRNDRFRDFFDLLEGNSLTSHADAPGFTVIRFRRAGQLVTDSQATWMVNRKEFDRNAAALRLAHKSTVDPPNVRSAILFNAALARYCSRELELKSTLREADRLLGDESRRRLEVDLRRVVPGGNPHFGP